MLQIAICDDEENMVQNNTSITEEALRQCQSAGKISPYTRSDNLLYDFTEDGFFFDFIGYRNAG